MKVMKRMKQRTHGPSIWGAVIAVCAVAVAGGAQQPASSTVAVGVPRPIDVSRDAAVAARRVQDPEAKLAALAKARSDFAGMPVHPDFMPMIDEATLVTLYTNFPDRLDAIGQAFDRAVAGMPSDSGERLRALDSGFYNVDALSGLIERKLLLNRIEQVLRTSIGAFEAATRPDEMFPDTAESLSFGLAKLGYVAFARGEVPSGLAWFWKAFRRAPDNGDVAARLATYHLARDDRPAAEELARGLSVSLPGSDVAASAALVLADAEMKRGQFAAAERWLVSALGSDAVKPEAVLGNDGARAMLALARLEEKRGAAAAGILERYMRVAGTQGFPPGPTDADLAAMRALNRKVHGSEAGLDARLDAIARATRPVTAERYSPSPARTTRTVLLELFTGSGCRPCVGVDLAVDGVGERYGPGEVAILAYHAHVPRPDPMVVSGALGRATYYGVTGVPAAKIDGTIDAAWGARREYAQFLYADYFVTAIDRALETAPEANVTVRASLQGDTVRVTATTSALSANARDLRLHLVLAERQLSYASENFMRLHSMGVRAVAGNNGSGVPLTAAGTIDHTFSLATVRDDVARSLAAEIQERRSRPTPAAGASKVFYAEHHAMTAIDPSQLVIVAFVQDGSKRVLQAAQAEVVVKK